MEDYYYKKNYVPAFGSWDWNNDLPFTECFESSTRPAGFLRYSYTHAENNDLYVSAADLYDNHILTPAVIVVPRRRTKVGKQATHNNSSNMKAEKQSKWGNNVKEVEVKSSTPTPPIRMVRKTAKPVDEDLYKIPQHLLYHHARPPPSSTKKRGFGFLSSCLLPVCAT